MKKSKKSLHLEELVLSHFQPVIWNGILTSYYATNDGIVFDKHFKELSQFSCSSGKYKAVHIKIENTDYKCMVHRIIAIAFIPNPENKPQVNHIDADTFNNKVSNLEWVTSKENIHHMIKLGNQVVGVHHKNSKYSEKQIHQVCKLLNDPDILLSEIVKHSGVSMKTVQNIRKHGGWKHISKDYKINSLKRLQGPKYSKESKIIIKLIRNGKSNNEIREEIMKSGINSSITPKSLTDRIYYIRKTLQSVESSTTIEHSDVGVNTTLMSK